MARNKKVEILSNDKEVLHPMTDGDCVIFEDGQTLAQKLSEDDSVKYTPEIVNSSPMFKVGEGNTVDYSDNVLDGAYERATLQGQTYVNYIQESSADEVTLPTPFTEYERTQHNTLTSNEEGTLGINLVGQSYVNALQHDSEEEYVVLGESLEFQEKKVEYTNEGQIKSAMLKGQTLVNLCTYSTKSSVTLNSTSRMFNLRKATDYSLEKNKKYIIFINVTKCESTSTQQGIRLQFGSHNDSNYFKTVTKSVGRTYCTFTTGSDEVSLNGDNLRLYMVKEDADAGNEQIFDSVVLLEYQDGMENWDIPYFEGMQSVTVSTRLENKLGTCTATLSTNPKNGKTLTINDGNTRSIYLTNNSTQLGLKPNTKYIVGFKVSNLVLDGLSTVTLMLNVDSTNRLFEHPNGNGSTIYIDKNGVYRFVMKTTDNIESTALIKGIDTEWENSGSTLRSMTISEIMYVEYQNGMENWDLPYFEDYQVMKPVQVESVNKNLQPLGTYSTNTSNNVSTLNDVNGYIRVVPGKKYRISCGAEIKGSTMRWFDRNKKQLEDANGLYREAPTNAYYMRLLINTDLDYLNTVQVEESIDGTVSAYIDNKSKTTYSWDEVILRKVGDVEDTLDLTTGEWVQRIGEIVLDGSDDEEWNVELGRYWTPLETNAMGGNQGDYNALTDKYTFIPKDLIPPVTDISKGCCRWGADQNFMINHDDAEMGLEQWRNYLKQNPVKVQYILTTPIVHKVNLSRPNLQVYDDITHVHTKCLDGTLVPNIYLPSDISYPTILESNTTYNVCINQTEVSADNPLTVNVGGTEIAMTDSRMTLTTPTTLANSNVSFTGKGNKIKESMLIKNSSLLTRDLPHFNGIGSVQLGKTIENLCGSDRVLVGGGTVSMTTSNDYIDVTMTKAGSCVFLFELLKVLEDGKSYFIYAPNTYPTTSQCYASFRGKTQGSLSYTNDVSKYGHEKYWILTINHKTDSPYSHLCLGQHGNISVNAKFRLQKPIICEYEPGMENWDWESIGYFTGTKNIGNEFMRVQNKNLFDTNNATYGTVHYNLHDDYHTVNNSKTRVTMKELIKINKNSTLTLSCNNGFNCVIQEYISPIQRTLGNDAGWKNNHTLVLNEKTNYVNIYFRKPDDTDFTDAEMEELKNSIQLEESSTATTYTAHKHNGLYITKDQPIELTWEQGNVNASANTSWNDAIQNTISKRIRTKLITLKPNTSYRVSLGNKNYMWYMYAFDGNNVCPQPHSFNMKPDGFMQTDFIFTTTQQLYKIALVGRKVDDTNITPSEINHIRLEEVTDVVLRGIGNVHDELDITRGIYTQRIGEIVFDGDELWNYTGGLFGVGLEVSANIGGNFEVSDSSVAKFINNRYNMYNVYTDGDNGKGITLHAYKGFGGYVFIRDGDFNNVNDFKAYLQKNPIIIHYVLGIPIVHKVHIGNKNEANTEVAKPNEVFTLPTLYTEQTHIDLTNNGIIPKVQSRDYIAYPVLPMISRTYTLQHNLTGGVSNLTIDLLGRTQSVSYQNHKSLIYSPETMDAVLHNELRISGKGKISGVMYIDGGYMDRDIPYIEGMKNAVNPIVKNVGKNLFDGMVKNGESWWDGKTGIIARCRRSVNLTPVKPNTEYIFKLTNRYGIGCGANFMAHGKDGKFLKYIGWVLSDTGKFTTPSDCYYIHWYNDIDDFTDFYIEEVSTSSQHEPYKENICYVDCGEIKLTPDMFEQGSVGAASAGSHYNSDKTDSSYRIRTKELIKLEIGEQYVFLGNNDKYKYSARFYDMDGNKKISHGTTYDLSWKGNTPFTILNDAPMCAFFVKKANDSVITVDDIEAFNFQLVKVSEIKQMRSLPHGVHDEIDLETGTYIQRVGEITFNGTESWLPGYASWDNKRTYYNNSFVDIKTMKGDNGSGAAYYDAVRCPQLHRTYMSRLASALIDGVCSYYYSGYQRIFISKQDCATVDELKLWLKENPITVQYELPEPIVKDIVIHNYPHSYEGGHVIIENGDPNTPIPAQLTYRAVTNRSGQIQQHTEQVEKQDKEINELETLILANIHLSQTR